MSELEDIIGKATTAEELNTRAQAFKSEILSDWYDQITKINEAMPGQYIGDKLLYNINANASDLDKDEADKIIDLARLRLLLHTRKGSYRGEYSQKKPDTDLENLPELAVTMKKQGSPETTSLFLDYCKSQSPHMPVKELLECYMRFIKVKEFYDGVDPEAKDLPILRDSIANKSWDVLRDCLDPDNNDKDKKYLAWINEFERMEKVYNFNFTDVMNFIRKQKGQGNENGSAQSA